ncbi:carbohydrate ABC transporter permease [Marinomonas sp.]|uniref:carbohydrate ABC transporter permease n=1 Tax=Marinomonas sp. TaxID=1904862 RepID=UPI001E0234D6|nr:carbohydrate ABC transporter permease [Gammaproteobacteria bacterium]MBU1464887.1 carbohydrate ABC transporter permease [Gammaproteobacteria bacterium]MBU2024210.1 carbohydrate ABC transporter permease [Gammaproteobacteria bacterium]MBU2239855.1 carbohydrate ABC transporter permease [Gammaproteobacteria bacterium]MBU2321143.1 carbohydrate ABC transporter permease [Gammaproteobacteria bacterium]
MKLLNRFIPSSGMRQVPKSVTVHAVLLAYTVIALFPIIVVVINAFKERRAIFRDPLGLPDSDSFTLVGFQQVLLRSDFGLYSWNSLVVTILAVGLVLLLGAMAAWALTEYKFKGNLLITFLFAMGIMIPIRLGTVSILSLMVNLDLVNTLTALVLVYIAQGLPLAVYILSEFVRTIPKELTEAARCDSVSEYKIFFCVILPLLKPAMATVAVFTMIPIWNDLWFPLILAPGEETRTITLGVQQFVGQYVTDWNSVLSALTLAIVPVLILYTIFSRQLIRGLTSGAVK